MEADDSIPLIFNKDESNGIKWITFDEAQSASAWYLVRPIHKKLIKKLKDKWYDYKIVFVEDEIEEFEHIIDMYDNTLINMRYLTRMLKKIYF